MCCLGNAALSRHGQRVRQGTRGRPRELEGIRRSLLCRGVVQLVRTPATQEPAGSSPVATAVLIGIRDTRGHDTNRSSTDAVTLVLRIGVLDGGRSWHLTLARSLV